MNLDLLASVSHDLMCVTGLDEMMQSVGAKIGAHLDLSLCAFVEIDETAENVEINHDWHREEVPGLVGVYRLADFVGEEFIRTARAGEIIVVRDTVTDPRTEPAKFTALKIASFICVPLIRDGQWRFALCLYHSTAYDWREEEIELTRELTVRIWTRTERLRAEEALRESQRFLRSCLDALSGQIAVLDESGKILEVNEAWRQFADENQFTTPNYGIGLNYIPVSDQIVSQEGEAPDYSIGINDVIAGRRTHFEIEYPCHSPTEQRWFVLRVTRFQSPRPVRIVLVHDNCTERKLAEDALRESKERYRNLFNSIDEGYCVVEMIFDEHKKPVNWRYLEVNPSFEKESGMHNASGKLISEFFPNIEQHWLDIYGNVAMTGEPIRYSNEVKDINGGWFDLYAFRVGGSDNRQVAVLFRNITARKNAEHELSEKARLLDLSHDAIIVRDREGRISYWNHGAEELYGWSSDEAVGKISHTLLHTEFSTPVEQITDELHRADRWTGELVHTKRDGQRVTVLVRKVLDRDSEGNPAAVLQTLTDITARKQTEEALQESEARFRMMANAMPQLAWIARPDGHIIWYNQRWFEYTGKTPEEMEGWGWQSVHDPNELPKVLIRWRASIASGEPFDMTFPLRGADGTFRLFLTRVISLKNAAGQVVQWFGTNTDVHEIKLVEAEAREAGERFRFLAESMPQKIFTVKLNGDVDYFNQQWLEFTGLTFEQLKAQSWKPLVHRDDLEETLRRWKHSLKTGESFEVEQRLLRKDGVYRWHSTRVHAMRNAEGKITMWIGSNPDIDDLMRAQEELVDSQALLADRATQLEYLVGERTMKLRVAHSQLLEEAEERKRLEAEVTHAVEAERERLGQELHDGIAQDLTGIGLLLRVLEHKLKKPSPKHSSEAGRLCKLLEKTHECARNLARDFYPVELEQHGLLVALKGIAMRTQQQFGVACALEDGAHAPLQMNEATAVQLFRIAQEAVHNAVKHAQAKKILIHLSKQDGAWLLTVEDDGVGLPGDAHGSSGMGQRIMQYRARLIQGTLTVHSTEGCGVIVSCVAPAEG